MTSDHAIEQLLDYPIIPSHGSAIREKAFHQIGHMTTHPKW
jgi:hypothetical protein